MENENSDLRAENEALRKELNFIKTTLTTQQETSLDGIIVVDEKDNVVSVNQVFSDLLLVRKEELRNNFYEMVKSVLMQEVIVKEQFTELVNYIKANPDKTRRMEILVRTGKIVDVYSAPVADKKKNYYGRIWYFRDITDQKRVELELGELATKDGLTEVFNRKFGLLYIEKHLQTAKRDGSTFCICYVDVNKFKAINDTYGHGEGDVVLKTIGRVLKETLREVDIICRTGGDEFLICFHNSDVKNALIAWQRILGRIEKYNKDSGKQYSISLSHGFAEFRAGDQKTLDQMIAEADSEMYKDKAGER